MPASANLTGQHAELLERVVWHWHILAVMLNRDIQGEGNAAHYEYLAKGLHVASMTKTLFTHRRAALATCICCNRYMSTQSQCQAAVNTNISSNHSHTSK